VHGTKVQNFESILEHGLQASVSQIYMVDEIGPDGSIAGLDEPPEILIFIDEAKARSNGMGFDYDDQNDTWFTTGIDSVIRPWFFQKVLDNRPQSRGGILFQSKDDPAMWRKPQKRPRYIVHGTYWENLIGVMDKGVIPAKHPVSERRKRFAPLLSDAEGVVHCVDPVLARMETQAMREEHPEREVEYQMDIVGLDERPADALVMIDVDRMCKAGVELVQSDEREDQYFVKGVIPADAIIGVEQNVPVSLPASLMAKIFDPKTFAEIPIIDLSRDDTTVLTQLRHACTVVGFMQVTNHGVPKELQERLFRMSKAFFDLAAEKKKPLSVGTPSPVRGYFGKGGENLDKVKLLTGQAGKKSVTDNKEGVDLNGAPWAVAPDKSFIASIFHQDCGYPSEEDVPGFRETLDEYRRHMMRFGSHLLRHMAKILNRPPDFFEAHIDNVIATQRLLHYWPLKDFSKEIGTGEHTDYGLLTLLLQDGTGGLQVLNAADMQWVHATPVDGAYVVNIGDILARWTGNFFKSTVHRVVNTAPRDRYSAPFFMDLNFDSVVTPGDLHQGPDVGDMEALTGGQIMDRYYTASGMIKDEHRAAFARGEPLRR